MNLMRKLKVALAWLNVLNVEKKLLNQTEKLKLNSSMCTVIHVTIAVLILELKADWKKIVNNLTA